MWSIEATIYIYLITSYKKNYSKKISYEKIKND
jgi:hypothetical protein